MMTSRCDASPLWPSAGGTHAATGTADSHAAAGAGPTVFANAGSGGKWIRRTADGGAKQLGGAVKVPMGAAGDSEYLATHLDRMKAEQGGRAPSLLYNEFIVYDVKQVLSKFVVQVDFEFQ